MGCLSISHNLMELIILRFLFDTFGVISSYEKHTFVILDFRNKSNTHRMKKAIATTKAPGAIGPYSQAIETNGILFISGQIPIDPATGVMPEGITAQAEQCMKNLEAILHEAGYAFENVVKSTCLLADMSYFADMNAVYGKYFKSEPPARAAFAVKELPKKALVEIELIAAK